MTGPARGARGSRARAGTGRVGAADGAGDGLEVSYNENYCLEGLVERRRGATECEDGVGEAHRV